MLENMQVTTAPVTRMALEPYPVNPYRWHAILETADFYQTARGQYVDAAKSTAIAQHDVIYKPADTPAVEAAKQTLLGKVYLDWGRWAVVRDRGPGAGGCLPPPDLPRNRTMDDGRVQRSALCLFVSGFAQRCRADRRWADGFISWTTAKMQARGWADKSRNRRFCSGWKDLLALWNGLG